MKFIKSFLNKFSLLLIGYVILFLLVRLFVQVVWPFKGVIVQELTMEEGLSILPVFLFSFILVFTTLIYLFNSFLQRKWMRLRWQSVILFMGGAAVLGPTFEILINTFAREFFGQGFWVYKLLPVHGGDTSIVMSVIWPLYGFHMYCFHKALVERRDRNEESDLAMLLGVDAITLEILVNLFSLSFFYTYIFYYFAGDLHHLSTAVIFIPYVLCGLVVIKLLHFLEKQRHHLFFGVIGFILSWIIIFYEIISKKI